MERDGVFQTNKFFLKAHCTFAFADSAKLAQKRKAAVIEFKLKFTGFPFY